MANNNLHLTQEDQVVPLYDKMGWGEANQDIKDKHFVEATKRAEYMAANPFAFVARDTPKFLPAILTKFNKLQENAGRGPGSIDLTLLDYFAFKKRLRWFQQDGGTCVWSNTFRPITWRMIVEIALRGDPEEYFGTSEFGPKSVAPHCVQYGFARQLANMRSGDGLYASPMAQSLLEGMVMCNTPKLKELMDAAGATRDIDYPEPRNLSLYRKIGNWAWNSALQQYRDYRLTETAVVESIEEDEAATQNFKPMFMCSGIAIKAIGKHKDGFTIHDLDPRDSWAHNMARAGKIVASDNDEFLRISNLSWMQNTTPDQEWNSEPRWTDPHEKYIYNIPKTSVEKWYRAGKIDVYTIGEIQMPESAPFV